jgi:uncharacterized membrane protein (UPF0127 family)
MIKYNIALLADTDGKRKKGLMYSSPLNDNECALFIFPKKANHSFWNRNVSYPLDIIFCDDNFKIVEIKKMNKFSDKPCSANNNNVKYVIEMTHGSLKPEIKKGDKVVFDGRNRDVCFLQEK